MLTKSLPQVLKGKAPAALTSPSEKTGVQVFHIGKVDQHITGKLAEGVQVLAHHLQLKGASAADVVTRHHFGNFEDGFLQLARDVTPIAFGIQAHKSQHIQAHFLPVNFGAVAFDDARLLQRPHASPARRGRQAHTLRQFGIGQPSVLLQFVQDRPVKFVQCFQNKPL